MQKAAEESAAFLVTQSQMARPDCGFFVSKISGDQIVRAPASANVDLGSGGAYPITVGIERVQKARLIRTGIWLNAPQRAFVYEKRCLYRAIVSPKSHGMPRPVI